MLITQKHKYALRAIFELAKHRNGHTKLADIADAQAIPLRFLEVIMAQLKRKGLVVSKRGFYGGYALHGTYWHDKFGQPMSHGCVNLETDNAQTLFEWADPVLPPGQTQVTASTANQSVLQSQPKHLLQ